MPAGRLAVPRPPRAARKDGAEDRRAVPSDQGAWAGRPHQRRAAAHQAVRSAPDSYRFFAECLHRTDIMVEQWQQN